VVRTKITNPPDGFDGQWGQVPGVQGVRSTGWPRRGQNLVYERPQQRRLIPESRQGARRWTLCRGELISGRIVLAPNPVAMTFVNRGKPSGPLDRSSDDGIRVRQKSRALFLDELGWSPCWTRVHTVGSSTPCAVPACPPLPSLAGHSPLRAALTHESS